MAELAHERSYPFEINRLSEAAGAEILGLDLSKPISDDLRDAILDALNEHHVLCIRDQDLSSEQQMAMTARFGELDSHIFHDVEGHKTPQVHVVTNCDENGKPMKQPRSFGSYYWHSDKSYHDIPAFATFFHARVIPPKGGETEFCNMYRAYDSLDDETKKKIEGLRAIHSWEANRRNTGNRPATEEEKKARPPVSHPIVRTHPDTGRKTLYVGIHVDCVEGMDREEGVELIKKLYDHAAKRENVYTHTYKQGDLIIWDNRCLMHRVLGNYGVDKNARVMHRSVVRGTKPF
jgi:alpha-ketoglutarate-dependent taurine dioxygenase